MRVGILEDDEALADQLEQWLSSAGHVCFVFNSGQRMMGFLNRETVDLLLLDWMVPESSGLDVIRWLKRQGARHPPVLMLTGRATEEDIVTALKAGADEYVVKPIQPAVLLARIEALWRLAYPRAPASNVERHGTLTLDTRAETVFVSDEEIPLTSKEFALLLLLFRNLDRTLSRSYIYESVWGTHVELQTRTLDAHISKIRAKLNLRANMGYRLVPIYGYGYRLESVMEVVE